MMNDCSHIVMMLTGFAAGELVDEDAEQVREHVLICPDCREELAVEQQLRATLGGLPVVPCPVRVTRRIQDEIEMGTPLRRRSERNPWVWLPAAVGLAAAAVLLVILLPSTDHSPESVAHSGANDSLVTVADATWTRSEIDTARKQALLSLALAARVIDRTEKSTVNDVFRNRLPATVTESLRRLAATSEGGQG